MSDPDPLPLWQQLLLVIALPVLWVAVLLVVCWWRWVTWPQGDRRRRRADAWIRGRA